MKVFLLGSLYPPDRISSIQKNFRAGAGIDHAANNLQNALVKGLDYHLNELTIITQPNTGNFPFSYKKIFSPASVFSHRENAVDYCPSFINLPIIKHFSKFLSLNKTLKKIIPENKESVLIIYGLHSPFLKAAYNLKSKGWKKLKICLIVPDLPQFMKDTSNIFYLGMKYLDKKVLDEALKTVDSFVVLNSNMLDYINVGNKPWIRIEGIFNELTIDTPVTKEKNRVIFYTGNLDERYGIRNLLKAFQLINNENYRLWIRGKGNTLEEIADAAKSDKRIIIFDEMPLTQLQIMLKKATILVNPVPPEEKFSRFFFPSKIMNYMASGTPVLTTKIDGIPNEYYKYMLTAESGSVEQLKNAMIKYCETNQESLDEIGFRAAQFVMENKNYIEQTRKIIEILK